MPEPRCKGSRETSGKFVCIPFNPLTLRRDKVRLCVTFGTPTFLALAQSGLVHFRKDRPATKKLGEENLNGRLHHLRKYITFYARIELRNRDTSVGGTYSIKQGNYFANNASAKILTSTCRSPVDVVMLSTLHHLSSIRCRM